MISYTQNFVCWPSVGPQDINIHTYMRVICLLFSVSPTEDLLVGSDVVVMVCILILAVLSTPPGMIECVNLQVRMC